MNITGIGRNYNMQYMPSIGAKHQSASKDPLLKRTLIPPSEKESYSKEDALLNQYLKQYRIEGKIDGDTFSLKEGSNVKLVLGDQIRPEELNTFYQKLVSDGLDSKIDWQGVKNDFVQMDVGFENVDNLDTKVDYISSRYAILKSRIDDNYSGDEKNKQLDILNNLFNDAKKTIADSYASSIGKFYEDLGNENIAAEMRESLISEIDTRVKDYQEYLSDDAGNSKISDDSEGWLHNDDAYMAALLRDKMSQQEKEKPIDEKLSGGFSLYDLGLAGVFAHETNMQYNSLHDSAWPDDEQSIGLDLAFQSMQVDALVNKSGMGNKMGAIIEKSFSNYMGKYLDKLDSIMDTIANKNPMIQNIKHEMDREAILDIYNYTMNTYKETGSIADAIKKGADKAQRSYYASNPNQEGFYTDREKWDNFFNRTEYGDKTGVATELEKYQILIERFENSLSSHSLKTDLFFGQYGKSSSQQFSDAVLDIYA